jgi:anti-sigma regulatory factor (Ser/Thr protein kinase)
MPAAPAATRFPGTHAGFADGFSWLRQGLDAQELGAAPRYNVELVFEEIVANIVNHGAVPGRELQVGVTLQSLAELIVLTFEDNGMPFDPCQRTAVPVPAKSLAEAQLGGLGLMLVRRAARTLHYERTADGGNRLTVTVARGTA